MGRPRRFEEVRVLEAAAAAFVTGGYAGTSVDDLVRAVDLHRGSLYQAFGSKRGVFVASLRHDVEGHLARSAAALRSTPGSDPTIGSGAASGPVRGADLDLLLVAALERGHRDHEIAALVRQGLDAIERATAPPPPRGTQPTVPPQQGPPRRALDLLSARLFDRLLADPAIAGTDRDTDSSTDTDSTDTDSNEET